MLASFRTYDYLACLAHITACAVLADNVHIIKGRRLAHRAGLWLHAVEIADHQHALGLSEAFHQVKTRVFLPAVEYLRIQSLACDTAVLYVRKVIAAQTLFYKETVHCGRRTE